jgi:GT2 family glycosyltransferase
MPDGAPAARRSLGPISAVVCNFDGEGYIAGCLDSLLAQDEPLDEIIVVDNGSADGSVDVVRKLYKGVKLLLLPANGGPCVARNAGMRAARNRFVLAVDNDALLAPDFARRARAALEEHPEASLAQGRSMFASDPARVHYDGAWFHYAGLFSLRNFCRPLAEAEGHGTIAVDGAIAIANLLDRDVVLTHGGYDEAFFILFEDFDLSLRLRIAGVGIVSVEDAIVRHRGGTPGISFRGSVYPRVRAYYHARNRWLLIAKNYRWRTLLAALPGIAVYECAWLVFAAWQGHLAAHVRGKWAFLCDFSDALSKRRAVQAARTVHDRALFVGGPITLSPQLVYNARNRGLARALDLVLGAWWKLARPLAG